MIGNDIEKLREIAHRSQVSTALLGDRLLYTSLQGALMEDGLTVVKGLTEEQFEQNVREGDIKRGEGGRFSKTHAALAGATAVAGVAAVAVLKSRKLVNPLRDIAKVGAENVDMVKRSIVSEASKKAGVRIDPSSETVKSIFDIEMEVPRRYLWLGSEARIGSKEMVRYLLNPRRMSQDLCEAFGHLDIPSVAKRTRITDSPPILRLMVTKNLDYLGDTFTGMTFFGDKINFNLRDMTIANTLIGLTPKQVAVHEFAHSLTMSDSRLARRLVKRHERDYEAALMSLKGRSIESEYFGGGISGQITDVSIGKRTAEELVADAELQLAMGGLKLSDKQRAEVLKRVGDDKLYAKIEVTKQNGEKVIIHTDELKMMYAGLPQVAYDPDRLIKVSGYDHRDMYGLSDIFEFISVRAEKGERI